MELYLKTKDFSFSQEEFNLLYDEKKDLLVTSPKPDNLSDYYNSEDYISHTDAKNSFFEKTYQKVKRYNLQRKVALLNSIVHADKTVLDVGSGTGDFLAVAKSKGWMVQGVEPNKGALDKSLEKGVMTFPSLNDVTDEKFHIITLWHVLEHFSELDNSIALTLECLESEGTLVVAVPNFKSCDAHYYNTHWAGFDVPRHVWHFSRKSIEVIFSKFGLKVVKTKPMWFDAFYVSILSEKYRGRSFSFIRGAFIGLYSNLRALLSGEYSSLIYVLKRDKS